MMPRTITISDDVYAELSRMRGATLSENIRELLELGRGNWHISIRLFGTMGRERYESLRRSLLGIEGNSKMGSVLDTNIVIEVAAGSKEEVLDEVLSIDNIFYLTTISRFELLTGNLSEEEKFWIGHLNSLPSVIVLLQ